jgi:hypothetical protein
MIGDLHAVTPKKKASMALRYSVIDIKRRSMGLGVTREVITGIKRLDVD